MDSITLNQNLIINKFFIKLACQHKTNKPVYYKTSLKILTNARILYYSGCKINIRELTNFEGSVLHDEDLSC